MLTGVQGRGASGEGGRDEAEEEGEEGHRAAQHEEQLQGLARRGCRAEGGGAVAPGSGPHRVDCHAQYALSLIRAPCASPLLGSDGAIQHAQPGL